MSLIRALIGLVAVAVLIGVGVVIGVVFFDDDEDNSVSSTITERLNAIQDDMDGDIDEIVDRINQNQNIDSLRQSLLDRCGENEEALRESQGSTDSAEKLGDICDEIRSAPSNATDQWNDIKNRLNDLHE